MSMEYVRAKYGVPAKRGARVEYVASDGNLLQGVIVGTKGARLRVRLDGAKQTALLHPMWRLVYLGPNANITGDAPARRPG